jgi:phosphoglycerate dehydrogenase-like enzyme
MKVLITDHRYAEVELERQLLAQAGIELVVAQCHTQAEVVAAADGCFGLLSTYAPVDAQVFAARPEVRIVSRYGAGYDTVNVDDARRHGVWVANSPDYGIGEVATHALALALALVRRLPWLDRDIRAGTYHYKSAGPIRRAADLTLGILGLGRIGKRMALLARESFARVVAHDPYLIEGDFPPYVTPVSLDQLFAQSDVLSLHVPLTGETRGLVDAQRLRLMKPGAMLVNSARGGVVNLPDLIAALNAGRLDSAALDVQPEEPIPQAAAELAHPRILLTPHAAFYSEQSVVEMRRKAAQNLVDFARCGRPTYVVCEGRRTA